MTEQEEQERREAVAAVEVHERQVTAARARVDGAHAKREKFAQHLAAIDDEIQTANSELDREIAELEKIKALAEKVLAEGPVSISGEVVEALAGTATATGSVN